jgi:hypothetical protein
VIILSFFYGYLIDLFFLIHQSLIICLKMSSFIGCVSSFVYNSFIKNVGPPLGLINYKKEHSQNIHVNLVLYPCLNAWNRQAGMISRREQAAEGTGRHKEQAGIRNRRVRIRPVGGTGR